MGEDFQDQTLANLESWADSGMQICLSQDISHWGNIVHLTKHVE